MFTFGRSVPSFVHVAPPSCDSYTPTPVPTYRSGGTNRQSPASACAATPAGRFPVALVHVAPKFVVRRTRGPLEFCTARYAVAASVGLMTISAMEPAGTPALRLVQVEAFVVTYTAPPELPE